MNDGSLRKRNMPRMTEPGKIQVHSKITIAECAYYAYFLVMFGARAIGLYEGMLIYNLSLVAGMLLFGLKVILTEHTVSEYIVMGALLLLSLIVYGNTGEKGLLLYMTMMLGMKHVPIQRIFKWAAMILAIAFPVASLLSITGVGVDNVFYAQKIGMGEVARHSLGYAVHNTAFTTYIILVVLIMYVLGRMNRKQLLLVSAAAFIGAVYVYLYTVSYTGMMVTIIYLVLNYYFQTRKQLSSLEKTGILLVYPVCILFSVVGPLIIDGKLFAVIDKILNNRWNYARYFLTAEPVTLLGARFGDTPNGNYMIDSSFLYSFLQIGLVSFVVLTVLYLAMICDYVKQDKRIEIAIIMGFCVLGISDPFLFNLSYKNLLFLFAGEFLYRHIECLKEKLPGLPGKKVQWFKIGSREVKVYTLPEAVRRWYRHLTDIVSEQSGVLFLVWCGFMFLLSGFCFVYTDVAAVIATVDNIEKWEYIRSGISMGFWGASLIVTIYTVCRALKEACKLSAS